MALLQREISTARRWLIGIGALYVGQALLFLLASFCVLHVVNDYPHFESPNRAAQAEGAKLVLLCEQHASLRESKHSICDKALQDAEMNVRLVSLEQTWGHLLGRLNILEWPMFHHESAFGYVMLRTMDNLVSSTVLVLVVAMVICLWMWWTFARGPLQSYATYELLNKQSSHPDRHKCMDSRVPMGYDNKKTA